MPKSKKKTAKKKEGSKRKAFGYVRVSTTGQSGDGSGLDTQRLKIQTWCSMNEVDAEVFCDVASGSTTRKRPELARALDEVCKTKGVLVCPNLTRLARSTKDAILISERLDAAGADLVLLQEGLDTSTSSGKLFFELLAAIASFERRTIVERVSSGIQRKKESGMRYSRFPEYGYSYRGDKLVLKPKEQVNIKRMLQLRKKGLSLAKLSAKLEAEGIVNRNGKAFQPISLKKILDKQQAAA